METYCERISSNADLTERLEFLKKFIEWLDKWDKSSIEELSKKGR